MKDQALFSAPKKQNYFFLFFFFYPACYVLKHWNGLCHAERGFGSKQQSRSGWGTFWAFSCSPLNNEKVYGKNPKISNPFSIPFFPKFCICVFISQNCWLYGKQCTPVQTNFAIISLHTPKRSLYPWHNLLKKIFDCELHYFPPV